MKFLWTFRVTETNHQIIKFLSTFRVTETNHQIIKFLSTLRVTETNHQIVKFLSTSRVTETNCNTRTSFKLWGLMILRNHETTTVVFPLKLIVFVIKSCDILMFNNVDTWLYVYVNRNWIWDLLLFALIKYPNRLSCCLWILLSIGYTFNCCLT